jgi:hypothetical protein
MPVQIVKLCHMSIRVERTEVGFPMHEAGRDCCNKKLKWNLLLQPIVP